MSTRLKRLLARKRAASSPDEIVIIESPYNDPAVLRAVFGDDNPGPDAWKQSYFSLPAGARPALTPFFDPSFYLHKYPDVGMAGVDPYQHFLSHGFAEGRDPHPLIDVAFIRDQFDAKGGAEALDIGLLARILRAGELQPHPLFDVAYYLERYPDVRAAGTPAILHFITHGADEGRSPHGGFDADAEVRLRGSSSRYAAFLDYAGATAHGARVPPAAAAKGGTQGVFDGVGDHAAQGWAFDPSRPEVRLEIEILEGERVVARGLADQPREDLRQAGIGDGRCHFRLPVSSELRDGAPHGLVARVADSGVLLHGSHQMVSKPKSDPAYDALPAAETLRHAAELASAQRGFPSLPGYLRDLAACNLLIETGRGTEAVAALERLGARYPATAINDLKLGEAHMEAGGPAAAIVAFGRLDPRGPLAGWGLLGMGNASRLMEHWAEAEAFYAQAAAIAPELPQPRARLGQLGFRHARVEAAQLADSGDFQSAVARLVPELMARPLDPGICDMVAAIRARAAAESAEASSQDDPLIARSTGAWGLLEVVTDAARQTRAESMH